MFSEIVWTNKKEEEIDINEVFKSNAKMSYDASKDILVVYGDLIIEGNIEFQSELLVLGKVTVKSKKSKELSEEELLAVLSGARTAISEMKEEELLAVLSGALSKGGL